VSLYVGVVVGWAREIDHGTLRWLCRRGCRGISFEKREDEDNGAGDGEGTEEIGEHHLNPRTGWESVADDKAAR
jgi:hypothetical protein